MRVLRISMVVVCLLGLTACGDSASSGAGASAEPEVAGEKTYRRYCFSCHVSGAGGAPRFADPEAWADRRSKSLDELTASVRNGMGTMPAMGMCNQCSEQDLVDAVQYMLDALEAPAN